MKKTIAGPAAGSQGRVVIHVDCDDGVTRPDFIIPAGTPAGTTSKTYEPIAVGDGVYRHRDLQRQRGGTEVVVTGDGQEVTIPSGKSETVKITNTYHHVGSLLVQRRSPVRGRASKGRSGSTRCATAPP